jgi:hypothetical protein
MKWHPSGSCVGPVPRFGRSNERPADRLAERVRRGASTTRRRPTPRSSLHIGNQPRRYRISAELRTSDGDAVITSRRASRDQARSVRVPEPQHHADAHGSARSRRWLLPRGQTRHMRAGSGLGQRGGGPSERGGRVVWAAAMDASPGLGGCDASRRRDPLPRCGGRGTGRRTAGPGRAGFGWLDIRRAAAGDRDPVTPLSRRSRRQRVRAI